MGLSSLVNAEYYSGDGNTKTFAFDFKILRELDLRVTVRNQTTDVETLLTLNTDYTVSGILQTAGGTITLVNPDEEWSDSDSDLKSGYDICVRRYQDLKQRTDLKNLGAYHPEIVEQALDMLVMMLQQLQNQLDRSARFQETINSADFDNQFPAALVGLPNATVVTNESGDGWTVGPTLDELAGVAQDAEDAEEAAANAAASERAAAASAAAASVSASAAAASAGAADASADAAALSAIEAQEAAESIEGVSLWVRTVVPFASLSTAGLVATVDLNILPARGAIERIVVKHSEAFAGGAISALVVDVGVTGALDKYLSGFDVFQTVSDDAFESQVASDVPSFAAPTTLKLTATAVGANLSALSAGSLEVLIKSSVLPSA